MYSRIYLKTSTTAYFCLPSCNFAHDMEIPADFRCSTLLPGFGSVSIQLEWPPVRTAVWPLVWQNRDHQEDHLVCQPFWDNRWVQSYLKTSIISISFVVHFIYLLLFTLQVISCTLWASPSGSYCQADWLQVSLHRVTLWLFISFGMWKPVEHLAYQINLAGSLCKVACNWKDFVTNCSHESPMSAQWLTFLIFCLWRYSRSLYLLL